jgi:hypothetical protein
MSAIGKFINNFQDPLATLGRVGVKAGEFIAEHSWARWSLMAVEAISGPLMFAGRQAVMASPLGEALTSLEGTVMERLSRYVNTEGRLGDPTKAKLVLSGAILGVSLLVGGVGLFAKIAVTAGKFMKNLFRKKVDDIAPPPHAPGGNGLNPVAGLSGADRLAAARGKRIPGPNGMHPATRTGRNDGQYGEGIGLDTLETETGMRFQPLQNPSGHGADGVFIDAENGVIYVAEVKSSTSGIAGAAVAEGNPFTKLEEWANKAADSGSGWRTQSPANITFAEQIRAALRSTQYRVEGIQVQVGVPAVGMTGPSSVLIGSWR